MEWNIAPECVSLVIIGIIWIYSRRGSQLPTLRNKMFHVCLAITFFAMLSNIISTFLITHYLSVPLFMTWGITTVYFILTPLMGAAYFHYVLSVVYRDETKLKRMIGIGIVPAVLYLLLVLLNPFTHNLFSLSAENGYERGSLIEVTYIIFYAYCVASLIVTVAKSRLIDWRVYRILAAFPVLAAFVILIQQRYPDVILSGSAATCAMLIIYLHLQNRHIYMDYLTGIPNRKELLGMLDLLIKRSSDRKFTLAVISLREFRQINNMCGQQKGDEFIKSVGRYLSITGPRDNVYRFNGDEFALLFIDKSDEEIDECLKEIMHRMELPWQIEDYWFILPVAVGVIRRSDIEETVEDAINGVEYAIAQAKVEGYGIVCYCDREMMNKLERRRQIIDILREKLENQSFEMFYQPIYSVKNGKFCHAESLMRINDSPIGPIYPSEFIPIAEETGMIIDITFVILDKVCKFINKLLADGIRIESIHVNFSALQFSQSDLAENVLAVIRRNNTPANALKIELTESTLAKNSQTVIDFAMEMKRHGIQMGLDDFGTGYSNFATVIDIPFGTMKLDKSMVWAAAGNKKSALAVKDIIRVFKHLGMDVIAEGVETKEQRELVVDIGVDQIQGFYYSKPLNEKDMEEFMRKENENTEN